MRWKLLLIASLLAAIIGGGLTLLVLFFSPDGIHFAEPGFVLAALLTATAITYASIFVYRHTARRRALQATLTVLLAACFIALILVAATEFLTLHL